VTGQLTMVTLMVVLVGSAVSLSRKPTSMGRMG
jgi:hypothetical protein